MQTRRGPPDGGPRRATRSPATTSGRGSAARRRTRASRRAGSGARDDRQARNHHERQAGRGLAPVRLTLPGASRPRSRSRRTGRRARGRTRRRSQACSAARRPRRRSASRSRFRCRVVDDLEDVAFGPGRRLVVAAVRHPGPVRVARIDRDPGDEAPGIDRSVCVDPSNVTSVAGSASAFFVMKRRPADVPPERPGISPSRARRPRCCRRRDRCRRYGAGQATFPAVVPKHPDVTVDEEAADALVAEQPSRRTAPRSCRSRGCTARGTPPARAFPGRASSSGTRAPSRPTSSG